MLPPVLAGTVVFGAAIPWIVIGLITLAQRLTPPELQGRVYAAAETLITTPQTISFALGAALITVTGYQTLLLAMACTIALAAAYLFTRPEHRHTVRQLTRTSPASRRSHTVPPGTSHAAAETAPRGSVGTATQAPPGT